eukprot:127200_1
MSRLFQAFCPHVIITIYVVSIVQSLSKQVVLTSQNTGNDGATVSVIGHTGEVTSSNTTTWDVTSLRPDTWHLVVNLDNSWGFDPNFESNITFEINGGVLADNLIFAFTTPQLDKYIAIRIREEATSAAMIVPATSGFRCPLSGSTSLVVGNVTTAIKKSANECTDSRWCRLGLWASSTSDLLEDIQGDGEKTFPIEFTLINIPGDNSLHFMVASGGIDENYVEHCFYEAFDTNQGLQIYFAVDNDQTPHQGVCTVNSLTVTYSTAAPPTSTDTPTKYPTDGPVMSATSHPTKYPTVIPSKAPSDRHSRPRHTMDATPRTSQPTTAHPNEFSTQYPSKSPASHPSAYPSRAQTYSPTKRLSDTSNPSMDGYSSREVMDDTETSRTNDSETQTETEHFSWKTITILVAIIIGVMLVFCCFYIVYILLRKKSKSNASDISQLQLQSMSHEISNVMSIGDDLETVTVEKQIRKPSNNELLDEVEGAGNNEDNKPVAIQTNTRRGDINEDEFIVEGSSDEGEDDHVTVK